MNSVWMSIDDRVYDVTAFLDKHPGGREYLLLAAGRDATDLFRSYHPFTTAPRSMLAQYDIGRVATRQYPKFKPDNGFYETMSRRINTYFKANKIDPKDPFPSIWRMSVLLVVHVFCYLLLFTPVFEKVFPALGPNIAPSHSSLWWAVKLLVSVVHGWSMVMFLLHIMHDCSHSSVGHNETWWKIGGRAFSEGFIGSSMVSWHNQHVVGHHIYTNVYSIDPDMPMVAKGDLRLIAPQQAWSGVYKYQHIYLPILYSLLTLKARLQDYGIHASRLNGPIAVNPVSTMQWIRLAVSKANFLVLRLVIPYFFLGLKEMFILNLVTELVGGAYLALNFQVSHVSDEAEFPVTDSLPTSPNFPVFEGDKKNAGKSKASTSSTGTPAAGVNSYASFTTRELENSKADAKAPVSPTFTKPLNSTGVPEHKQWDIEWAALQVRTSVDYKHNSWLMAFMCGALNYQTEHHLFPSVSQYLYPQIAPIVMQTCKEFGVQYNYIPTFTEALMGHINHLRIMGQRGEAYTPHLG